jgi:hypothetical protein
MMPPELRELILRFNRIGAALPDDDAILSGDPGVLADVKLLVAEMNRVKAEIDAFLDQAQLKRSRH